METKTKEKDVLTIRIEPELYDKMMIKLRSDRKNKSINKYINELIEKDLNNEYPDEM